MLIKNQLHSFNGQQEVHSLQAGENHIRLALTQGATTKDAPGITE